IKKRVMPLVRFKEHFDDLRDDASSVGVGKGGNAPPVVVAPTDDSAAGLLDGTREVVVSLVTVVILTLFLLAGGPPMMAKMTAAFFDDLRAGRGLFFIDKVRAEVRRFYLTPTFINLGLGVATTLVMMAWGMPTPYLWGALAAALNYVPYLGPATTLTVVTVVAMVTFTHLTHILGVAA